MLSNLLYNLKLHRHGCNFSFETLNLELHNIILKTLVLKINIKFQFLRSCKPNTKYLYIKQDILKIYHKDFKILIFRLNIPLIQKPFITKWLQHMQINFICMQDLKYIINLQDSIPKNLVYKIKLLFYGFLVSLSNIKQFQYLHYELTKKLMSTRFLDFTDKDLPKLKCIHRFLLITK